MKSEKHILADALDWANRYLKEHPELGRIKVVEEAAFKYDLGPMDEDWLLNELCKPMPPD